MPKGLIMPMGPLLILYEFFSSLRMPDIFFHLFPIQYFRNMHHLDAAFTSFQQTLQMHQAGHIHRGNYFNSLSFVILNPVIAHTYGYRLLKYREGTPKAAALVFSG